MIKLNKITAIIIGAVVLALVAFGGYYNSFVTKNTAIDGQWAQVETQYQRRIDLIPNLVSSTQGFLTQEKTIFEDIARARTQYGGAKTIDEKANAATGVESALGRLLVIMENYPNLKSDATVAKLMDELAGTENRISVERRRYNEQVLEYNTMVVRLPGNIIARFFGFSQHAYFQSSQGADQVPKVEL